MLRLGHLVRGALALQHQVHGVVAVAPAEQPHHEVGHVAMPHAADLIRHGPVEAEVARPGVHIGVLVESRGHAPLEAGVTGGHVQLAALSWCAAALTGWRSVRLVSKSTPEVSSTGGESNVPMIRSSSLRGRHASVIACAAAARWSGAQQPPDVLAVHRRMVEPHAHGAHRVHEQSPAARLFRLRVVGLGRQARVESSRDLCGQVHHDLLMPGRGVIDGPDDLRLPRDAGQLGHGRRSAADGVLPHPGRVEVDAGARRLDHVARERRELDAPGGGVRAIANTRYLAFGGGGSEEPVTGMKSNGTPSTSANSGVRRPSPSKLS